MKRVNLVKALDSTHSCRVGKSSGLSLGGLSVVVPYFNSPEELEWMTEPFRDVDSQNLELIVVDDHSTSPPPIAILESLHIPAAVVRICRARRWGMTGAANWGAVFASKALILKTDVDHRIKYPDIIKILNMEIDPSEVILFARVAVQPGVPDKMVNLKPHSNSFLIHRHIFLSHGMYDERFSGHYGYDDKELFSRLRSQLQVRTEPSISLEMRFQHDPQRRNRTVNRLRLQMRALQSSVAPMRLVDDAHVVFKANF